jgi:hypothetical protein
MVLQVHNMEAGVVYKTKYNECTNLLNDWHFMRFVRLAQFILGYKRIKRKAFFQDF